MRNNYDIIVVGSGLTGLCISISLAKIGYKVALVDKISFEQLNTFNYDSRTTALSSRTVRFLEKIKAWKKIKKHTCSINRILVEEPFFQAKSYFDKSDGTKALGYMIENKNLIKELTTLAKAEKNIYKIEGYLLKLKRFTKFIEIHLSGGRVLKGNLLIGADGKNSKVRNLADIKFSIKNYKQKAFIFNIKHEKSHKNIAIENFLEEGPLACLPIKKKTNKKFYSSIVWSSNSPIYYSVLKNKNKFLNEFLRKHLSNRLGSIKIVSSIKYWDLALLKSKDYIGDRVILLGDSAHSIHPLAGQGFNLTIRSIEKLSSIGQNSYERNIDIGSFRELAEFNYKHYLDAEAIIFATDKLNSLFSNSNPFLKIIRGSGLKVFSKSSFLKNIFRYYASGGKISSTKT